MGELSERNFGLVIAYVLPGFVGLWGISYFSPTVDLWLRTPQLGTPNIAGFCYATLASLAVGLTVSAVRWAIIDTIHHATGIAPPPWRFARFDDKLQGFMVLVESHYRFYQFYANTFVAAAFCYRARLLSEGSRLLVGGLVEPRLPYPGGCPLRRLPRCVAEVLHADTTVTQHPLISREEHLQ